MVVALPIQVAKDRTAPEQRETHKSEHVHPLYVLVWECSGDGFSGTVSPSGTNVLSSLPF